MNYIEQCIQRAEDAKLSSDDHGHDTTALRIYCESELYYAYDTMVPELCKRLKKAIDHIEHIQHAGAWDDLIYELEAPIKCSHGPYESCLTCRDIPDHLFSQESRPSTSSEGK